MKPSIAFSVFFILTLHAFAQISSQRYEIIGSNSTGSKVAFLLTHFAPSSQAPMANLYVIEASTNNIIYKDTLFDIYGDEERITFLKKSLLIKSKEKLKSLGITKANYTPLIGLTTYFGNQILIESDLFSGIKYFNTNVMLYDTPNEHCSNKINLSYKITAMIETKNHNVTISRTPSALDCSFRLLQFSNLFKIGNHVWYIFYETHEMMPDLFFREFKAYSFLI